MHPTELISLPSLPAWLSEKGRNIQLRRGEALWKINEPFSFVWMVKSGSVLLYRVGECGQEEPLMLVGTDGVIGEAEVLAETKQIFWIARAYEDTQLLRIPAESFKEWIRSDHLASLAMVKLLAKKLCVTTQQGTSLVTMDAMGRLVSQLLMMGPGRVPFTRQQLADTCYVSMRTINRCVNQLLEEGYISILRGKIVMTAEQIENLRTLLN